MDRITPPLMWGKHRVRTIAKHTRGPGELSVYTGICIQHVYKKCFVRGRGMVVRVRGIVVRVAFGYVRPCVALSLLRCAYASRSASRPIDTGGAIHDAGEGEKIPSARRVCLTMVRGGVECDACIPLQYSLLRCGVARVGSTALLRRT